MLGVDGGGGPDFGLGGLMAHLAGMGAGGMGVPGMGVEPPPEEVDGNAAVPAPQGMIEALEESCLDKDTIEVPAILFVRFVCPI